MSWSHCQLIFHCKFLREFNCHILKIAIVLIVVIIINSINIRKFHIVLRKIDSYNIDNQVRISYSTLKMS